MAPAHGRCPAHPEPHHALPGHQQDNNGDTFLISPAQLEVNQPPEALAPADLAKIREQIRHILTDGTPTVRKAMFDALIHEIAITADDTVRQARPSRATNWRPDSGRHPRGADLAHLGSNTAPTPN